MDQFCEPKHPSLLVAEQDIGTLKDQFLKFARVEIPANSSLTPNIISGNNMTGPMKEAVDHQNFNDAAVFKKINRNGTVMDGNNVINANIQLQEKVQEKEKVKQPVACPFENLLLRSRYLVKKFFACGSFSRFHQVTDIKRDHRELLIKISKKHEMNSMEFGILTKLNSIRAKNCPESYNFFPKVYDGGEFIISEANERGNQESKKYSFIIMEKLGKTLQTHLIEQGNAFSMRTVCQIGIQLLQMLQQLHLIGKVYNDLKLDNILVSKESTDDQILIKLIDFGLATSFIDAQGMHIKREQTSDFKGNLAMSSIHAMNFETMSRRDDLLSLTYVLVYMCQGQLDFLNVDPNIEQYLQFDQIYQNKKQLTPEKLCKSKKARFLTKFASEVFKIEFDEQPNYLYLSSILQENLSNPISSSNSFVQIPSRGTYDQEQQVQD